MSDDEVKDSTYRYYVCEIAEWLKDSALEAKQLSEQSKGTSIHDFDDGVLSAYRRVISSLQAQAEGFGLRLEDVNLHDINPDKDLV